MIEIIIITYNRMRHLVRTLNAIKESDLANLKVTVLDNCSDDGTAQMLEDLVHEGGLQLLHIRLPKNVGACANLMRAYELATEEYIWILCDDDEYDFKTFTDVLAALKNNSPDVLIVGTPISAPVEQLFSNRVGKLLHAHEFRDTELLRLLTFLPSAIINTGKLKSCDFRLGYELSHTFFPQLFWISQVINADWSVYVMPRLMVTRPPIEHGLDSDFTHLNGYLRGIELFSQAGDIENARSLYFGRGYLTYAVFIAKLMMREKITGRLSIQNYLNHLVLLDTPRRLICAVMWIIFLIPSSVLSALKSAKKRRIDGRIKKASGVRIKQEAHGNRKCTVNSRIK